MKFESIQDFKELVETTAKIYLRNSIKEADSLKVEEKETNSNGDSNE